MSYLDFESSDGSKFWRNLLLAAVIFGVGFFCGAMWMGQ